jgi:hypothetical protein
MLRFQGSRLHALVMTGLAVVLVTESARAADKPLSGKVFFAITSLYPGPFALVKGSSCAPLGDVTGTITVNVTGIVGGEMNSGTIVLKNAQGDTLTLSYEVRSTNPVDIARGRFKVVSGTGRFQDATGDGEMTRTSGPNNPTVLEGSLKERKTKRALAEK